MMPIWLIVVVVVGWVALTFVGAMIVGKGFAASERWGRPARRVSDIPNARHDRRRTGHGTTADAPAEQPGSTPPSALL